MTPVSMPPRATVGFWYAIQLCLMEFHGWQPVRASERVWRLRASLALYESGPDGDLIVHMSPFEIACDLAGAYLDLAEHRESYDAIVAWCQGTLPSGFSSAPISRGNPEASRSPFSKTVHDPELPPLTPHELDIVLLIVHGHTMTQIAEELGISNETVVVRVQRIRAKLGLMSSADLIEWARSHFGPAEEA